MAAFTVCVHTSIQRPGPANAGECRFLFSFVSGIDFRGGVVPPTVHPPTKHRQRRLAVRGSRAHQTWRPPTVGARLTVAARAIARARQPDLASAGARVCTLCLPN